MDWKTTIRAVKIPMGHLLLLFSARKLALLPCRETDSGKVFSEPYRAEKEE